MKAFAVFSEGKAGLIRVWAQSWEARGWRPQLLTSRELEEHGSARKAAKNRGGGLLTDLCVINFSCRSRSPGETAEVSKALALLLSHVVAIRQIHRGDAGHQYAQQSGTRPSHGNPAKSAIWSTA